MSSDIPTGPATAAAVADSTAITPGPLAALAAASTLPSGGSESAAEPVPAASQVWNMAPDLEPIPGLVGNAAATAGKGAGAAALPVGLAAGRGGSASASGAGGRMTPAQRTHNALRAVLKASAIFGFGGMGVLFAVETPTCLPL